jgi:hypothetical protein
MLYSAKLRDVYECQIWMDVKDSTQFYNKESSKNTGVRKACLLATFNTGKKESYHYNAQFSHERDN